MIYFWLNDNINIKATDGTLVTYNKLKVPVNPNNSTAYISTYEDFLDLKEVLSKVDKDKFHAKTLIERKIRTFDTFPIELGISNENEFEKITHLEKNYKKDKYIKNEKDIDSIAYDMNRVDLYKQLKNLNKDEVKIVLIGGVGKSISEIMVSCTALRIFYNKLKEVYKKVKLDIYISASNNTFYSRDKLIYQTQDFVNEIYPLSITLDKFTKYDYYIDNSSVLKSSFYFRDLNLVDAWLYKFGIDYKKIPDSMKYNQLNLNNYEVRSELSERFKTLKSKGKLLLFHPYSANVEKSIPQAIASEMLKNLILEAQDYTIVSTLSIDGKIFDDNFIDLSKESKIITDFIYIVSNMNAVVTVDTSTYHISETFMIPTVVFFTREDFEKRIKYYSYIKSIFVKDESKNLSKFIFTNENLTFYKLDGWKKLKVNKIIKLLESF